MTSPSITVLIDTYNYQRFIERAIDSVIAQTYPPERIEILVIDDGSTDGTRNTVTAYGDRVRYIWKPNGGQGSALNRGFREAQGEIVCLLDADDYFYPAKLARVAEAADRDSACGLIYNEFDIVSDGTLWPKTYPEPTWTGCRLPLADVRQHLRSLITLGHPWSCITSAMSMRRSVLEDITIPEGDFPHSPDLFLGLVLPFMTGVDILATPLTGYVFHGENVGLFRSSAENRTLYRRQLRVSRQYLESHFGTRFMTYAGRSIYGSDEPAPSGPGERYSVYLKERKAIAGAKVSPIIKARCQAKLLASCGLPTPAYTGLQDLRSRMHSLPLWTKRTPPTITQKVGG